MSEKKENGKHLATIADYQRTFGSVHGKRVLRHLMKVHGLMLSSHVSGDSHATAFNEGGRNAVIQILNKVRINLNDLEKEINKQPEGDEDVII